jgi:2-keto-4-pentenoate hydratase/2-oxohepta-3-ene-1,7-dioic acid hydratase in catechol pathway
MIGILRANRIRSGSPDLERKSEMSDEKNNQVKRVPMLYCAKALVGDDVEILVGRSPSTGEWYSASALWDLTKTTDYLANRHELSTKFHQLNASHRLPPPLTIEPRSYLAPVDADRKIFAVGVNYHSHVKELGVAPPQQPFFFIKPTNTLNGPFGEVVAETATASRLDYEVELAVVLAQDVKNLSPAEALVAVGGLMVANDVSAREWYVESGFLQWVRMKGQDGFCPIGPWITPVEEVSLSRGLRIRCSVNGELRQSSSTDQLIFDVEEVVSFVSMGVSLGVGDVILTGTPAGVAMCMDGQPWLQQGDEVVCEIDGLGALANTVSFASSKAS